MSCRTQHAAAPPEQAPSRLSFAFGKLELQSIGAPKRKLSAGGAPHGGLPTDSSSPVRLVVLSRALHSKDEATLQTAARTPFGAALLLALEKTAAEAAAAAGTPLKATLARAFFSLSASSVASQRLYGSSGLVLPSKLPWARARELLGALLAAVTAAAAGGHPLANRASQAAAVSPQDEAAIRSFATDVQARTTSQLGVPAAASAGPLRGPESATASARSSPSTVPPPLPPLAVVATDSLATNLRRAVEARLEKHLSVAQVAALDRALDEALSLLQAGGNEARAALLASPAAAGLAVPAGAQLWATALEGISQSNATTATALIQSIVETTVVVTSALFASAAMAP